SAVLLVYRLRQAALERDVAFARAKSEATEDLARVLLAVRDLSNTPLQTIAFASQTALQRHPELGPVVDRIDRSLARLRDLDRKLRSLEHAVKWTRREVSFDAEALGTEPRDQP